MHKSLRLLICVQAVDEDDRLMGFFVEWLQAAAQSFVEIHVLALRVGRYNLPPHVHIYPLRKKTNSTTRGEVIKNVLSLSWKIRHQYDAVFVRGDTIYVLLFSWLWRLLGKPVILWFAHYKANWQIPWAYRLANAIVTSVPEACAYPGVQPIAIGQAINQARFQFHSRDFQKPFRALTLGRVLPIKGVKDIVRDLQNTNLIQDIHLRIVGPSLDPDYAREIETLIANEPRIQWNKNGVSYDAIPELLNQTDLLLNAYPGSLDKVIVEAMLSGIIPVFATSAINDTLPSEYRWLFAPDAETRRHALERLSNMSPIELQHCARILSQFALEKHSVSSQIQRLQDVIETYL